MADKILRLFTYVYMIALCVPLQAAPRMVQADFLEQGSSSFRNFIRNSEIEKNDRGWVAYDDAAAIPVDCTGGSPSSALTVTGTTPLAGDFSLNFNIPISSQGEGFSYDYKIDEAEKGHIQRFKMLYKLGIAAEALKVYIYDIDAAEILYPSQQSFDGSGKLITEYQPNNATSDDFRVCVHVAENVAAAATNKFDSFDLGPRETSSAFDSSPIGTIIATGIPSTNPPNGYLFCNGASVLRADYPELFAAIGTAYGSSSGTTFNLPNLQGVFQRGAGSQSINGRLKGGLAVGATQEDRFQGHWHNMQVGTDVSGLNGSPNWLPAYNNLLNGPYNLNNGPRQATSDGSNGTPRTSSETFPSNVAVNYFIKYKNIGGPISSDFGNRVISFAIRNNSGTSTSVPNNTITKITTLNTVERDTAGGWDASNNWWVVPESGEYMVCGSLFESIPNAGSKTMRLNISGTSYEMSVTDDTVTHTLSNCKTAFAKANDKIFMEGFQNTGSTQNMGAFNPTALRIHKIQSPETLLGGERVVFYGTNTASTNFPNTTFTDVPWSSVKDTHGGFDGTNTYTVKVAGDYDLDVKLRLQQLGNSLSTFEVQILVNGSLASLDTKGFQPVSGVDSSFRLTQTLVNLKVGDNIKVRFYQGNGAARVLTPQAAANNFSIQLRN